MATLTKADSKRMYSWWWDSHISPKNSKWLQENLADTDSKVKQMIKLVEVDEDSFARRAEMYYKKRPELMKLIEEFYRAYRALAERYDHAAGVIKQAHKTMAKVFPNQVPFDDSDDGSFSFVDDSDPHTPQTSVSIQTFHDHLDEVHYAKKGGDLESEEAQNFPMLAERKAKKSLNFHGADEKLVPMPMAERYTEKDQVLSNSDRLGRSETDIQALKEVFAEREAEKQASLLEYQESLRKLSKLETEVFRAQEDSSGLHERACNAEAEVQILKESLAKLEGEREASLEQYQQACKVEKEAVILRVELEQVKTEKEAYLAKYMEALENIANLENKLLLAEDKVSLTSERAYNAEKELAALKEVFDRATEEKEAAFLERQKCLEKIAGLESEVALSREKAARLKVEIDQGGAKLKVAEEQCLLLKRSNMSMQVEMDSFLNKLGVHNQELSAKQKELGRLWTCIQDEHLRFVAAETALRDLRSLHSQTQDELKSAAAEIQRRVQLMKDMEILGQSLQDEVEKIRGENKSLSEINLSSSVSMKNMQDEILNLKEEHEMGLIERSALQKEIYCLRKELNYFQKAYQEMLEQVRLVGFQPDSVGSSVIELQDENSKLRESWQRIEAEISAVSEKLTMMEKLTEKKAVLENSLSELCTELEAAREKVKELEEPYQLLMKEKSAVISQLELVTDNFKSLAEKNLCLDNSLFQANEELETLRKQSKILEVSCQILNEDKSVLLSEKQALEEQEESQAVNSQFEIFILKNIMLDLKETKSCLQSKCDELVESSKLSERLLLELEYENIEQQEEENFLSEQIKNLRMGMFQLVKVLDVDLELAYEGNLLDDQIVLHRIVIKLDDMKNDLGKAWDENQKLVAEKSILETLHAQLKVEVADLKVLINTLQQEFRYGNNQLSSLHKDMPKLLQSHEELILRVTEGNHKEDLLADEVNNLRGKLLKLQGVSQNVEKESCRILGENKSLMKAILQLDEDKQKLEYENSFLVAESVTLDTLSFIFKNSVLEKSEMINQLGQNMSKLCDDNSVLQDKVRIMEMENLNLKDSLEKYDDELEEVRVTNNQLQLELASERDELSQKEMELLEAVMVEDDQSEKITKLSERYAQKLKENESLQNSKQNADAEMRRILKKQIQTEGMVEMLHSKLEKGKDEAELWETVAGSFFIELQTCSVREALFREKFSELTKEYECIEAEDYSKGVEILQLKEKFESLEGENSRVRAQLAQLIPSLASLRDSVASLENHAMHNEYEDDYYKDTHNEYEDDYYKDTASFRKTSKEEVAAPTLDGFSDLQNIAIRMKAVENKVMEMKKLSQERSLKALKSRSSRSRRTSGRSSRRAPSESTEKQPAHQKHASYPCEAGELMMKDIMLDQTRGGYNNSERSDDQILELWETMDQTRSIDLTVEVDKKEIPKLENNNNRKVLESLASDAQRLANLEITVQDLKQKVMITEDSNPTKAKTMEYVRVKEQLQETDKAIAKLLDITAKLMKKIDNCNFSPNSSVGNTPSSIADSPDIGGSKRRTNVTEQARRCSQKTGRLQLEVQKIQFLLLNLDGRNKMGRTTGTRVSERNSRILLKDYLYVGPRTPRRRKKAHFCGCVQPPTSGD